MYINLLAEGQLEAITAERLLPYCGHELGTVYGRKGFNYVKNKASFFHHSATDQTGILVLTDFRDSGANCISAALNDYVYFKCPNPPKTFLCNFSVNELESWFLADNAGLAKFLNVSVSNFPLDPENEADPKKTLVELAYKSKTKLIKEGIAPPAGHRAKVGPEYLNLMNTFIIHHWNIEKAAKRAPSLERCIRRLKAF